MCNLKKSLDVIKTAHVKFCITVLCSDTIIGIITKQGFRDIWPSPWDLCLPKPLYYTGMPSNDFSYSSHSSCAKAFYIILWEFSFFFSCISSRLCTNLILYGLWHYLEWTRANICTLTSFPLRNNFNLSERSCRLFTIKLTPEKTCTFKVKLLKRFIRQYDSCPTHLSNNYTKFTAAPPPQCFKTSCHEPHVISLDLFPVGSKEQVLIV